MRIRSLLLAGAVIPFAAGASALALDAPPLAPPGWVLAQNEEECPEGDECPPVEEAPVEEEAAPEEEEEEGEEEAPEEEAAPEEEEAAPEEEEAAPEEDVAPEEIAPEEEVLEEALPEEVAPEEEVLEETAPEEEIPEEALPETEPEASAPEADETETLQAVPEETPAADEDETIVEEAPSPADVLRRARRQQRELRREEAEDADEQPTEETEETVEQPTEPLEEAPAAATAPDEADTETEAAEEQPTEEATQEPEVVQPSAEPATPEDVLRRARRQQRELRREQRQQEAEQPAAEEPAQAVEEPTTEEPAQAAEQPAAPPAPSVVEQQLEATGEGEQVDRIRALREKLREESAAAAEAAAPDEEAAASDDEEDETRRERRRRERGEGGQAAADEDDVDVDVDFRWWLRDDRDRDDGDRRRNRGRGRGEVVEDRGDRIIIDLGGGNIYVEPVVPDEGERLLYGARDVEVEELPNGRTRTIVYRENGSQIVTIRDRRGNIIRRVRVTPNGREVVLIDNRYEDDYDELPPFVVYEEADLPPLVIGIPEERYIVDLGRASAVEIEAALLAPPVQEIEREFTLEEVTRNERVRAYVPRIDLDTITFEFGSATIDESQLPALAELGEAMEEVLAENPDEVYLVEGHTDAVGSDYDNLILSDRRAEAVAVALSQNFEIPPENLVTEGYGEQYLKVRTPGPERENRRVTVRRITPLLQAEAQQQ